MKKLLLASAAVALLAAPTLAGAKTTHPTPAKHKMVKAKKKAGKTTTTTTTETKAN